MSRPRSHVLTDEELSSSMALSLRFPPLSQSHTRSLILNHRINKTWRLDQQAEQDLSKRLVHTSVERSRVAKQDLINKFYPQEKRAVITKKQTEALAERLGRRDRLPSAIPKDVERVYNSKRDPHLWSYWRRKQLRPKKQRYEDLWKSQHSPSKSGGGAASAKEQEPVSLPPVTPPAAPAEIGEETVEEPAAESDRDGADGADGAEAGAGEVQDAAAGSDAGDDKPDAGGEDDAASEKSGKRSARGSHAGSEGSGSPGSRRSSRPGSASSRSRGSSRSRSRRSSDAGSAKSAASGKSASSDSDEEVIEEGDE